MIALEKISTYWLEEVSKNNRNADEIHIEKAILAASKAAFLSQIIKSKQETIEKFENPNKIKDFKIKNPEFNKLNKLKKSNPEAFFYWYKTIELIK